MGRWLLLVASRRFWLTATIRNCTVVQQHVPSCLGFEIVLAIMNAVLPWFALLAIVLASSKDPECAEEDLQTMIQTPHRQCRRRQERVLMGPPQTGVIYCAGSPLQGQKLGKEASSSSCGILPDKDLGSQIFNVDCQLMGL